MSAFRETLQEIEFARDSLPQLQRQERQHDDEVLACTHDLALALSRGDFLDLRAAVQKSTAAQERLWAVRWAIQARQSPVGAVAR